MFLGSSNMSRSAQACTISCSLGLAITYNHSTTTPPPAAVVVTTAMYQSSIAHGFPNKYSASRAANMVHSGT